MVELDLHMGIISINTLSHGRSFGRKIIGVSSTSNATSSAHPNDKLQLNLG